MGGGGVRSLYYLLDGETPRPVSAEEWSARFDAEPEHRRVALTFVTPTVYVSTVFLGIDHGFGRRPEDPPVLFETMVFGTDDQEQWRYTSLAAARAGHGEVVAAVTKQVGAQA